jgi:hypothetical protein
MPASARLAHGADLFAIWYQFIQYTPPDVRLNVEACAACHLSQ